MLQHQFLGPVFGYTTANETTLWLRGYQGKKAFVRYRQESSPWCMHDNFTLIDFLDYAGVCTLPFALPNQQLHVEALLLDANCQAPGPDDRRWTTDLSKVTGSVSPAPADKKQGIEFLFGSCAHRGYGPLRQGDKVFETMIRHKHHLDSDFFLMAGDQVYADHPINKVIPLFPLLGANRAPKKTEQYFERYRNDFSRKNLRQVLAHLPVYMMFDDHEVVNNWGGYWYRQPEKTGKGKYHPTTLQRGMTAYLAYQALHSDRFSKQSPTDLAARLSVAGEAKQSWSYQFSCGLADFFVLDARTERTAPQTKTDPNGDAAMMLSKETEEQLIDFMQQKDVPEAELRYKFIVSPVPIAPDTNHDVNKDEHRIDTWRSYPKQRERILKACKKVPLRPVFLGGDLHLSTCLTIRSREDEMFEVPTIVSSALNWVIFGIQRESKKNFALRKIEQGTLVQDMADLKRNPLNRTGEFYVDGFNQMASCMKNNYMKISVTAEEIVATIYEAEDGSVHGTPWVFSKARLRGQA